MAEWEIALPKLKAAYEAWHQSRGNSIETWLELMAEQVDFRSLANGRLGIPWTKAHTSREEVRAYLAGLTAHFTMEHFTVDRFVCQDDEIVVIGSTAWRNTQSGKRFDTPKVDVWTFKDGTAVAFFEYYDTAMVGEAAT